MKAMVYEGEGRKSWTEVPDPVIRDPRDVIIQVDTTTICGTDLHILGGDVPTVEPGRVLGHEAVGTVVDLGDAVTRVQENDRVLVSCISGCGVCVYCRHGRYGQCLGGGGWILGHHIDGVQAQYARIPFADLSTYPLPGQLTNDEAVLLSDILPTGYEVGVRNGQVGPGDTVVVVGAGPIGLAAILTARMFTPAHVIAIDKSTRRLQVARQVGADIAISPDDDPREVVEAVTGGLGADVAIEAVGLPVTFELCATLVRPTGRVANAGVHAGPAALHLQDLWARDVTVTTGLVDTYSTETLLRMVAAGQLDVSPLLTHRFGMDDFLAAYDIFTEAAESGAIKVTLGQQPVPELPTREQAGHASRSSG